MELLTDPAVTALIADAKEWALTAITWAPVIGIAAVIGHGLMTALQVAIEGDARRKSDQAKAITIRKGWQRSQY